MFVKTNEMVDLVIPVIPPKIRKRSFHQHEIFLMFQTRNFKADTDLVEVLLSFTRQSFKTICSDRQREAMSLMLQILVALPFFLSCIFLQLIGDIVGLPKSSVSRAVKVVSLALAQRQNEFILWPSPDELREVKRRFYDKGGFPGVLGCVDGTHVRIHALCANKNDFVNRKGSHSINVQAGCKHIGR